MADGSVRIRWQFKAKLSDVWRAWTDPDKLKLWFGSDPNGRVITAQIDLQENGAYEVTFRNSDDTEYTCFGKYKTIEPNSRLRFTWSWKNRPDVVEFVTVDLREDSAGTVMLFEHADIDQETSHDYEEGWKRTFRKLDKILNPDI